MLVDDDPKGNTTLCDSGAPFYSKQLIINLNNLTWTTDCSS